LAFVVPFVPRGELRIVNPRAEGHTAFVPVRRTARAA
jgi:hypothetical protein